MDAADFVEPRIAPEDGSIPPQSTHSTIHAAGMRCETTIDGEEATSVAMGCGGSDDGGEGELPSLLVDTSIMGEGAAEVVIGTGMGKSRIFANSDAPCCK